MLLHLHEEKCSRFRGHQPSQSFLSKYHLHILSPRGKGTTGRYSRTTFLASCHITFFINAVQAPSVSSFSALLSCYPTALVHTHATSLFKHHLKRSTSFLSSYMIDVGDTFFLILNVP